MKKNTKNQSGFTLVELAIVMMIIGLLIGGILQGQELMENARVTSTISQVQAFDAATTSFRDIFNAWPGDIANATARVPNCAAATNCQTGAGATAGDGIVGTVGGLASNQSAITTEATQFWRHLLLADLVSGLTTTNTIAWGETHPEARVGGGFHVGHDDGSSVAAAAGNAAGHYLLLQATANAAPGTTAGANPVSPIRASQIDRKLDDGAAGRGAVIGHGPTTANTGCWETSGGENIYQGHTTKSCNLYLRIQS